MGIIRAAFSSVTGALSDQFLEAIEPEGMGEQTVFVRGVLKNRKNGKTGSGVISNGSVIHVYDNQFMLLVDGGKIVDYTAEPGYFIVDNSSAPSLFNGQIKESLKDVWERFKFAGTTPLSQQVYYINLQEIKGIKFGTRNPINYSAPAIRSIITTVFTMRNCFCVHTALIPLRSAIRSCSIRKRFRVML